MKEEVRKYVDSSVLCWLATSTPDGIPNVSPKEIFTYYGDDHIIVANIASPNTVNNIRQNNKVCISFIDVFVQKGLQINGEATIVEAGSQDFEQMEKPLLKMTAGLFPFKSIIRIAIQIVKPIISPRYVLFPETTEEEQIKSARLLYRLTTEN